MDYWSKYGGMAVEIIITMIRHTCIWVVLSVVIALMFVRLPQMAARQDAVMHTYSALVEVDALARQRFVEPFDDDRLVEGAIRGMMLQLDPYSGYISPRELAAFERRTHGDFIGVGMELGVVDGVPSVIAPIEGSPAARAGVQPGDMLAAVNGTDTKGLSIFDIEERLGGPPGTPVQLRVRRMGRTDSLELTVIRGPVTLGTVRGMRRNTDRQWNYFLEGDGRIAVLRVSGFLDNTMRDVDAALTEIHASHPEGIILDLRFNPGGVLQQAVEMVDRFVKNGLIVSTVTRRRAVHDHFATGTAIMPEVPMVVLINRFSASSSEIVAGVLQDHRRAVIVGERSFGKGSVQHLIHLAGRAAAVKLTVAYYRLPSGRIIHRTPHNAHQDHWGVRPDVEIALSDSELQAVQESRKAVDHPRTDEQGSNPGATSTPPKLFMDAQLEKAISILRAG